MRAARRQAAARGITRESVLAATPETRLSASARELGRLAARVDVWLWLRPGNARSDARSAALEWLSGQCEQEIEGVGAPPPEVEAELDRLAPSLRSLADALPRLGDARWPHALAADDVPNLSGFLGLQKLLLGEALLATRRGDDAAAAAWLDAAWRANELLQPRGEVISQLVRIAGARACAAVTCKVRAASPFTESMLDPSRFRDALADALAWDAEWQLRQAESGSPAGLGELDDPSAFQQMLFLSAARRAAAEDALDSVEGSALARDPARCGRATHPPEDPVGHHRNVAGGAILRLDALVVHLELARRVAELKRVRAADPAKAWPVTLPGGDRAECTNVRFSWWEIAPGVARLEAESADGAWWVRPGRSPGPAMSWQSSP